MDTTTEPVNAAEEKPETEPEKPEMEPEKPEAETGKPETEPEKTEPEPENTEPESEKTENEPQKTEPDPEKKETKKEGKKGGFFSPVLFFWILFIYLEAAFHILMFGGLSTTLIYPVLFSLFLGAVLGLIVHLLPRIPARILLIVLGVFFCVLFCAEVIYQNVFSTYFLLFGVLDVAGQALDFMSIILSTILECFPQMIVLFFVPVIFTFLAAFRLCNLDPDRRLASILANLIIAAVSYALLLLGVYASGEGIGTPYDYFFNGLSADGGIRTLGVTTTTWLNGRNTLTGRTNIGVIYEETAPEEEEEEEEPEEEEPEEEEIVIDTSPNILEIDFDQIKEESGNDSDVERLCDYIEGREGTNKNAYTGMFEGYNLIWITAEGFSGYCMSEEWTPNLWKMASEGFVFRNYYTPEYYGSTTGGEWSNLTGTVPNDGDYVSMSQSGRKGIDMLFTAGRQSTRLGYHTTGWHNNTYTYYYRDITFPNMGYEWYGSGNGYEPERNSSGTAIWPQSDVMLIEQSFPEYATEEPFMTYYMTVSGHMDYTWGGNTMSSRNEDAVRAYAEENGYDYSENTLGYLAAQKELDKAMGTLLDYLDKTGLGDRTLIVMSCDHVPYDDMDVLDDLAGETLNYIDRYKNALFIYSPSMEEPVEVDKYCCQIDMLATVSNLMGWDYDSRMLVGEDILSDSEQFVMFPNLSYITGRVIYNAADDKVTELTRHDVDDDYLQSMKEKAQNWNTISDLLFATDFFKYVDEQMPPVSEEYKYWIQRLRVGKTVDLSVLDEPDEEEEADEEADSGEDADSEEGSDEKADDKEDAKDADSGGGKENAADEGGGKNNDSE